MYQFDQVVQGSLSIAQKEAVESKSSELFPEHLLLGLLLNKSSYISKVFKKHEQAIRAELSRKPSVKQELSVDQIKTSASLMKWLTMANAHMAEQGRADIGEKDLVKFLPQMFPHIPMDYSELSQVGTESDVPDFLINLNDMAQSGK